jgi:hypothetical protein
VNREDPHLPSPGKAAQYTGEGGRETEAAESKRGTGETREQDQDESIGKHEATKKTCARPRKIQRVQSSSVSESRSELESDEDRRGKQGHEAVLVLLEVFKDVFQEQLSLILIEFRVLHDRRRGKHRA